MFTFEHTSCHKQMTDVSRAMDLLTLHFPEAYVGYSKQVLYVTCGPRFSQSLVHESSQQATQKHLIPHKCWGTSHIDVCN
jgi:hypothetical protein